MAQSQLNLFWVILVAGAIVFFAVEGAIVYMIFKFRRRDEKHPDADRGQPQTGARMDRRSGQCC